MQYRHTRCLRLLHFHATYKEKNTYKDTTMGNKKLVLKSFFILMLTPLHWDISFHDLSSVTLVQGSSSPRFNGKLNLPWATNGPKEKLQRQVNISKKGKESASFGLADMTLQQENSAGTVKDKEEAVPCASSSFQHHLCQRYFLARERSPFPQSH